MVKSDDRLGFDPLAWMNDEEADYDFSNKIFDEATESAVEPIDIDSVDKDIDAITEVVKTTDDAIVDDNHIAACDTENSADLVNVEQTDNEDSFDTENRTEALIVDENDISDVTDTENTTEALMVGDDSNDVTDMEYRTEELVVGSSDITDGIDTENSAEDNNVDNIETVDTTIIEKPVQGQEPPVDELSGEPNKNNGSSGNEQYLTFELSDEQYAIDILRVKEIKGWNKATCIPNSPKYVAGVINLRGVIVPIIDLRKRFDMPDVTYTANSVVIVMKVCSEVHDRTMGIIVDSVSDVCNIRREMIKPAPAMRGAINNEFVKGLATVNEQMAIVINIDELLNSAELALEKMS